MGIKMIRETVILFGKFILKNTFLCKEKRLSRKHFSAQPFF